MTKDQQRRRTRPRVRAPQYTVGSLVDLPASAKKGVCMNILHILQIVAAIATIATGLVSLGWPRSVIGFTGLTPQGGRGITEIRAVLGGFFIALGIAPLILGSPTTFTMLGLAYLGVALVRLVSIFVDRSSVSSNWISLAVEVVFGAILVL